MKKLKSRKGQMQMTETIAVMFIFFVLIMFAIIFYYKYQTVAFKEKQEELLGQRAMDVTLKALFMPELLCTKGGAEPEENCFDMMKVRASKTSFEKNKNDYYFDIFGYSTISIVPLYPLGQETEVVYSKEKTKTLDDGRVVRAWEKKEPTYFVIALREELDGEPRYGFGYIKVEVYS